MPLSRLVNRFVDAVVAFLDSPEQALLEVQVAQELEVQAAKLVDGTVIRCDSLVVPVAAEWSGVEDLCAAIAAEVEIAIAGATKELAEADEAQRFAWPVLGTSSRIPCEARLVEYLESFARAASTHINRIVVALAVTSTADDRPQVAAALASLVMSTGTRSLKWMSFCREPLLQRRSFVHRRRRACPPRHDDAVLALSDFCRDPTSRVMTLRGDERSLASLRQALPSLRQGRSTFPVAVENLSFVDERIYYTEASRSLTRQCLDLERRTSGGSHCQPLYDEAHMLVVRSDAEIYFTERCERLASAMLRDDGSLLVLLAPNRATPAHGLDASITALSEAAVSTRVRYIVADPRIAASYDEPPVWTTGVAQYAIAVDEIEAGMTDRLAAPDITKIEKLRYMTALSGMALAREDPQKAQDLSLDVLRLAQETDDPAEVTMAWYSLGNTLYQSAVFVGAEQAYSECVDRALDEKNDAMVAQAMAGLGHTYYMRKQFEAAIDCYETSAKLFGKLGVVHAEVYALTWVGEANGQLRRHAPAAAAFERALQALDRVDPALAREYSGQRAEVLMREANLFGKAGLTQQQRECATEARRLGAIDHIADHP